MEFKDRLQSKIKRHKELVDQAKILVDQAKIRLENEISHLKGLEEAYEMLQADTRKRTSSTTRSLRSGSLAALAFEYLKKTGTPQAVEVILPSIGKESTRENRHLLSRSLRDHVSHNRIFTNPMPNVFGLIGFEQVKNNGSAEVVEEEQEILL